MTAPRGSERPHTLFVVPKLEYAYIYDNGWCKKICTGSHIIVLRCLSPPPPKVLNLANRKSHPQAFLMIGV